MDSEISTPRTLKVARFSGTYHRPTQRLGRMGGPSAPGPAPHVEDPDGTRLHFDGPASRRGKSFARSARGCHNGAPANREEFVVDLGVMIFPLTNPSSRFRWRRRSKPAASNRCVSRAQPHPHQPRDPLGWQQERASAPGGVLADPPSVRGVGGLRCGDGTAEARPRASPSWRSAIRSGWRRKWRAST